MDLQQYVNEKYEGKSDWFVEEIHMVRNQQRVLDVQDKKEYLSGDHKILQKQSYKYNGKTVEPTKIVLQYAKTLLNFQKAYLLQNPITLTGDESVVKKYQKVNRKGKYNRFNLRVLDKVLKYGECAEYIYIHNGVIKSKLINADEFVPVYDANNNLLAVIEAFVHDGISHYIVYTEDTVSRYSDNGGQLRMVERNPSLSGLPIIYHNENELSDVEGRSELDDWISILDQLESTISKYSEATEKFLDPIFINVGQQLKGESLPSDMIGKGINLDDGSQAYYLQAKLDSKSFETLHKTLVQSLLDISSTPAVSMNKTDISNLSEVSIKLLFQLANIKASINEQFMRDGIEERNDKIRRLLAMQGTKMSDEKYETLDMVFQYATPQNDSEIIEQLEKLRELGGLSLESLLSKSPHTTDVQEELNRLRSESGNNVGNNSTDEE
ncbi:phage portal protein [Halobacillus faecis]